MLSSSVLAQADPSRPQFQTTEHSDSTYLEAFGAFAKTEAQFAAQLNAAGALMLRSRNAKLRRVAFDTITAVLPRALLTDSFALSEAELLGISRLNAPDGAWAIYTWQLFVNDSTYVYGGLLHQSGVASRIVALYDRAQELGLEAEFELQPEQWYGALYYDVRPFVLASGRPAWILFGYDADGFYHRRKIADVLSFSRKGQPLFGAEVFRGRESQPTSTFSRLILEYRADARVGLNYDEALGGIVHDRLVTGPPVVRGNPPSRIPDGSYDGYVFDPTQSAWVYREEWFDRVINTSVPRPEPVLNSGSEQGARDLFGRPRKVRKSTKPVNIPH